MAISFLAITGIANIPLSKERIRRLVTLPVTRVQKLAGELRFARTALRGRHGRAVLQPIYELITRGSEAPSQER